MEIGKKIKTLRAAKGVTQEALAQHMAVTPQAVSRWENGSTLPDITLLPALSVFFGVRIDELFELSDEAQYERLDNMLETEDFLDSGDFDYAERFLKDRIAADPGDARSLRALAELYNHRAEGYQRRAATLAKRSLEIEPEVKDAHSILSFAANGCCWDWCSGNHRELIDWYYGFVKANPGYARGYLWLLDNLIADGRCDEAEKVVADMAKVENSFHVPLYLGHIAALRGDTAKAGALWQQMLDAEPDNWLVHSCMGDAMVKLCHYDEAVAYYTRAAQLEPAPRYIDNWDSIGQIYEIQGRFDQAILAYEKVLEIYRDDWKCTEGYQVEKYRDAILCLKAKI